MGQSELFEPAAKGRDMTHGWKAIIAGGFLMLLAGLPARAALQGDWRDCAEASDPAAGHAACSRLIASGQMKGSLAQGYVMRAIHASRRNDYDAAIADFSEALRLKPSASYYADRASMYLLKGDHPRAVSDYDQALRMNPADSNAHYGRALALGRSGDYAGAIAGFDEALRRKPSCAICYTKRGLSYEKLGDTARARASFQAALSVADNASDAEQARSTARSRIQALNATPASAVPSPTPAAAPAPPPAVSVAALPSAPPTVSQPAVVPQPMGRRIALVIGNSSYRGVPALRNPRNDAATIADSLRSVGFQKVTLANDLTRNALVDQLKAFANEADTADWAMVYFAGHGIEVGGLNYVIPVDAKLASDRDIQYEAVALEQIVAATEGAKKLHLVVVDACRDNPFAVEMKRTLASRSLGRGLAQIEPDAGTLVVFSAKHGQLASDGEGANSPFVQAFATRIKTPQIEIRKLFDLVRDDVMAATGRRQQPYSYGSVPGNADFYFLTTTVAQAR